MRKLMSAIRVRSSLNPGRHIPAIALTGLLAVGGTAYADPGNDQRAPEVPSGLEVPEGHKVAFHTFAVGVQIYEWSGTAWVFVAPSAALFADEGANGEAGIHYAGPTWESNSGSKVVGARVAGSPSPFPDTIPWLLLRAVSTEGPGIFEGVTFIQRVNTLGGAAPSSPGTIIGQRAEVPYAAEYYFYREHD